MFFTATANEEKKSKEFAVKEAYKLARTNIDFSIISDECKTIVFTSPTESDGKSTTAINVAGAFAKQVNKKVLLVECDLRKPCLANYMGISNKCGLTDYLCKNKTADDIITETNTPNLFVILAGEIPPNPSELLISSKMNNLIAQLKGVFDYIIFDTPPVNVVVDALGIAKNCDGVVAVVRENKTNYHETDKMLETFKSANIKLLGFILNGVAKEKSAYRKSKYRYSQYKYSQYKDFG